MIDPPAHWSSEIHHAAHLSPAERIDLVKIDLTSGSNAFANIPSWLIECILPAGFGLMALRFALRAFAPPAHVPGLIHQPEQAQADQ